MIPVRESAEGLSFAIKVQPRARRNAVSGVAGDALKLAVTAPPVEGRANQAVIDLLATTFEIPRASITITSGENNRNKVVRLARMTRQALQQRLAEVLNSR